MYTLVDHLGFVRPVHELYHYNEDQIGEKIPHQFISGKTVKGRLISESFLIWPNHYPEHHLHIRRFQEYFIHIHILIHIPYNFCNFDAKMG